jgi:hypothetical protein
MTKSRDDIIRDCEKWPKQWMGLGEDVPYGRGIVNAMKPFIEALISEGVSDRTLRKHLNNLWLLGGEIIRDVSLNEEYAEIAPVDKLVESIGDNGGPYCRHLHSDEEQGSFDTTCRKLHRFLKKARK